MAIHKFIYRLDYKTNYEIMNRPGDVARLIVESRKDFFEEIGETNQWRQVVGKWAKSKRLHREITVDPRSFIYGVETVDGVPAADLDDFESFADGVAVLDALRGAFGIQEFTRAGIRLWFFEESPLAFEKARDHVLARMDSKLLDGVRQSLGDIGDLGIRLDGVSAAKVKYHFQAGPFQGKAEVGRYLNKVAAEFPADTRTNFVFDIDQFEENFTYGAATVRKWVGPLVASAASSVKSYLSMLRPAPVVDASPNGRGI